MTNTPSKDKTIDEILKRTGWDDDDFDEAVKDLEAHTNNQILAVLDRLEKQSKNYNQDELFSGFDAIPLQAIKDERNEL